MAKVKAKSVPARIWNQHKQQLHNLYITKGNTMGKIQNKMVKKTPENPQVHTTKSWNYVEIVIGKGRIAQD